MISVLLNLLRLVLWPRIWLILVYVLRELEKTMYSAALNPFGLIYYLRPMLPYFLSGRSVHWCKWGVKVP